MRNWIDLAEQAFGTTTHLYHGCSFEGLIGVIDAGGFEANCDGRGYDGPAGICLSRSFDVALGHAKSRTEYLYDSFYFYFGMADDIPKGILGAVFEFERAGMTNELMAFDDFGIGEGGEGSEEEERALGDEMPLDGLTAIYLDPDLLKRFEQDMLKAAEGHPDAASYAGVTKTIEGILNSPLLKPMNWKS